MGEIKQRCAQCTAYRACQYAFGKYWKEKSGGGEGCSTPFRATEGWVAFFRSKVASEKRAAWEGAAAAALKTPTRTGGILATAKNSMAARQARERERRRAAMAQGVLRLSAR